MPRMMGTGFLNLAARTSASSWVLSPISASATIPVDTRNASTEDSTGRDYGHHDTCLARPTDEGAGSVRYFSPRRWRRVAAVLPEPRTDPAASAARPAKGWRAPDPWAAAADAGVPRCARAPPVYFPASAGPATPGCGAAR